MKSTPPLLTPKESKVLEFIRSFQQQKGYSPTYAEIQHGLHYSAVGSVQQFIKQLVAKGCLEVPLGESQKRAIALAKIPALTKIPSKTTPATRDDFQNVPLEGSVAAGRLTEAVRTLDHVEVPRSMLKNGGEYFALNVKGESMIDDCIMDGDLVIIRRQNSAHNGQTVIALVDDEATIKRYYKKSEHIELHPANPNFQVIKVNATKEFKILGVLAGVIRKF